MTARLPIATALVLLFVAGCAATGSPTPLPSDQPDAIDQTVWQQAVNQVGDDGRYSLQAALDLFATAYGPLPGTTAEQNFGGEQLVHPNLATAAGISHQAQLSAEQRAALDPFPAPLTDADVI